MSSIFVSAIPKSVARQDVEEFLRSAFPTCVEVNVLRGAGGEETHKGHAYIHFSSESDALCAFDMYDSKTSNSICKEICSCSDLERTDINNSYGDTNEKQSLTLNNTTLRLRLCSTGQTIKHTKRKNENLRQEQEMRKENAQHMTQTGSAMIQKEPVETHTSTHLHPSPYHQLQYEYSDNNKRIDNTQYEKDECTEHAYGPPLSPAFIHCYWRCCAYEYSDNKSSKTSESINRSSVNDEEWKNSIGDASETDLPPFRYVAPLTMQHDNNKKIAQISTMSCDEADSTNMISDDHINEFVCNTFPCVVEFCTPEDCERAVELAPDRFVRVGAPLLEELMQSPSSLSTTRHSFTLNEWTKRMRSANSHHDDVDDDAQKKVRNEWDNNCEASTNVDARLERWREEGFTLLTPIEALKELEQLFNGQGRVAVKDESGSIAILRVPTYVASIE